MRRSLVTRRGALTIRQVTLADMDQFRELRLTALRDNPVAFSADYEKALNQPVQYWKDRLAMEADEGTIFVAEHEAHLIGMTGIVRQESIKTRHGAYIWGVYVDSEWRGLGIAEALMQSCIAWAKEHQVSIVKLGVATTNHAAIRCYERCGFQTYGVEPKAVFYEDKYYDEYLMAIQLELP